MKKAILAIVSAAILLGGGVTAAVVLSNQPTATVSSGQEYNLMTELKTGKYMLKGGSENEYIEVIDDHTLRFSGMDYTALVLELNDNFEGFSEEVRKSLIAENDEYSRIFNSGVEYKLNEYIPVISFIVPDDKEHPINLMCLSYGDDFNVLSFADNPRHIDYVYAG